MILKGLIQFLNIIDIKQLVSCGGFFLILLLASTVHGQEATGIDSLGLASPQFAEQNLQPSDYPKEIMRLDKRIELLKDELNKLSNSSSMNETRTKQLQTEIKGMKDKKALIEDKMKPDKLPSNEK